MIAQQRKRVERAVSDMIEDMYKTHLKQMQSEMHICAARCCDDKYGTLDTVQNCIEECAGPLIKAQDFLSQELGQFQGRLQKCIMQCDDTARNSISSYTNPKEPELAKHQYQFERCTVKCVDEHINLIPNLMKTIKAVLAKGPNAMKQA